MSQSNDYLLRDGLAPWRAEVPHQHPMVVAVQDGKAVSVCASVRKTATAHAAGVETLSEYRHQGHAAHAVIGWVMAVQHMGCIALYSTSWTNQASRRLAATGGEGGSDAHRRRASLHLNTRALEILTTLPEGIDELAVSAAREGFRFVDRLIQDYRSGENTFSKPGEVLFVVREGGRVKATGGLNIDPFDASGKTGRLRRLYVDPACRGNGMGRALVDALEGVAVQHFRTLRLFTDNADAVRFYLALGYVAVLCDAHASHQKIFEEYQLDTRRSRCCSH